MHYVLGVRVDVIDYDEVTARAIAWARSGQSRYVCAANVHTTMSAYDDAGFAQVIDAADLVTLDGMPLVWALRALEVQASQVRGPSLTLHLCEAAARAGIPIALYGGTPESLAALVSFFQKQFPGVRVVCQIAPPFRPLTPDEDAAYTRQICLSGARFLFVGLGCPKQEAWMAAHRGQIPAVMVGVGAAFDFYSGRRKEAPPWMRAVGLEWLFRLAMEPRRLWRRYTAHNFRFVGLFALQWSARHRLIKPDRIFKMPRAVAESPGLQLPRS